MSDRHEVIWHDLECGAYDADLALWRRLAEDHAGPVLDVGAGTGRVALDLARRGTSVVALDADALLLGALAERAAGLPVETCVADACDFDLDSSFPLILMPMQTIQLLGGAERRGRFLECARRHLSPGGLLAIAIVEDLEPLDAQLESIGPVPDIREIDGSVFSSRVVSMEPAPGGMAITWLREAVPPDGAHAQTAARLVLDEISADRLEDEARAVGLSPLRAVAVAPSDEYVGSTVVMLRG